MTRKPSWTSRSIGSRLQHSIFYLLIRLCGRAPAYGLLFFVVLWYTIRPSIRARSAPYLNRRFPGSTWAEGLRHCFRLNLEFGKTLVDRAAAGILKKLTITASPRDENLLKELHSESRGLILLTAHMGSWQTSMAGLGILESQVHVVMHRDGGDIDRHYFEHSGGSAPFSIIDPQDYLGGSLEMIGALRRGHVLCAMGDRVFGSDRNVIEVPFLGGPISVPFSPYRLAAATGAPIIVFFSRRTGPGRAVHEVARVIRVPRGLGRSGENYLPFARKFAAALEEQTRKAPYQFFNFYDMWENKDQQHEH